MDKQASILIFNRKIQNDIDNIYDKNVARVRLDLTCLATNSTHSELRVLPDLMSR